MPYYICPRCKDRSLDIDAREGFSEQTPACKRCGFGFLFEILDDYYPAPDTGMVVTDQDRRVLAIGRGMFELTGFPEADLMGKDLVDALAFARTRGRSSSHANGASGVSARSCRSRRAQGPRRRSWRTSSPRTTTTAACSSR